ncbi:hypothetical protein FRX31_008787 [Thalictrum thalictroides]|uniref:Uncharacterized protein n=1 Tax=Thalictrum thalictroides TaxID=46969 RepID=A0A7J6WZT2_THATH|nr:hypothetical protein FRX31_008787 [Thalictrum thalictroides]
MENARNNTYVYPPVNRSWRTRFRLSEILLFLHLSTYRPHHRMAFFTCLQRGFPNLRRGIFPMGDII